MSEVARASVVHRLRADHDYSNLNLLDWDVDLLDDGGLLRRLTSDRARFSVDSPELDAPDIWFPQGQALALIVRPSLATEIRGASESPVATFSLAHHESSELAARVVVVPLATVHTERRHEPDVIIHADGSFDDRWMRELPRDLAYPSGMFQIAELVSLYVGEVPDTPSIRSLVEIGGFTGVKFDPCVLE